MKKILIASYNLDFGGIETSLINLLKNFNYEKYEVTLVLEKKEGIFLNDLPKNIKVKEYKVNQCKVVLFRKIINMFKRIKWMLFNYKKYDASICYATYSGPCGFIARTSSKNSILFVHNDYIQYYKNDIKKVKSFFDNIKMQEYNHIVFVSNESRIGLSRYYPNVKEKMLTINNLIDHKKILLLSNERINIKKSNNTIFLFIGRLDEHQKRISRIIEVAKNLKKENIEFWIIGDGPERKEYEELIKKYKLNNIKLLGSKKNPYPYLKMCDWFLLTSDYEGFPVVYNEAIVLNKPILTTIDVTDDFISIPRRFGYVVKKDIKEITSNIKEILKNKEEFKEKVDFDKLNKLRIKMIEEIMEVSND